MTAKAWNGRCIMHWLNHCLRDAISLGGHDDKEYFERLIVSSSAMSPGLTNKYKFANITDLSPKFLL